MVLTAVSLITLLLCASLAVDIGHLCAVTAEVQNTADAAALAGAGALHEGFLAEGAVDIALDFIAQNQKPQGFFSLNDQVIELGAYNTVTQTFTSLAISGDLEASAVRVVSHRSETPYFFAAIIGKTQTDVSREAVAKLGVSCGGIWGLQGIEVPGGINTDSYISTDGAYSSLTARPNGDLCSGKAIETNGVFYVDGDAISGVTYGFTQKGPTGTVTGDIFSQNNPTSWPLDDFSDIQFANDNDTIGLTTPDDADPFWHGNNIRLKTDQNLNLAGGTYYFDSITMVAQSTMTFTGPTTVYVTGDIKMAGGGFITSSGDPHDLTIICSGESVYIHGSETFYGTVLAPYAETSLGGTAAFYGVAIGETVKIHGDFVFHADESLPLYGAFPVPWPILVR